MMERKPKKEVRMESLEDGCFWRRAAMNAAIAAMVALYLGGCSTTKPAQPEQTSQPTAQAPSKSPSDSPVSSQSSGSLDQMQKGQTVGTPGSSPLKDIYFDFDKADLRPDARETLKANAQWLKDNPSVTVQIEGHCDERGTAEYNLALGARRAQAAKDYLVTLGIPEQRISTISYGQEVPVCTEHNEECWQKNRHDRFVPKGGPTA
jgi:peptidoglycan-associated lipoprotein